MVGMIRAGHTVEEAADACGLGLSTVKKNWREWAREAGVSMRQAPVKAEEVPEEARRKVAQMRMAGVSVVKAAAETGVSENVIQKHWRGWAAQLGMAPPPAKKREVREKKEVPDGERTKKRAVLLKNQGWRTKDIAAETGLSVREIDTYWREWGRELGIELVPAVPKEPAPTDGEVTAYHVDPEKMW